MKPYIKLVYKTTGNDLVVQVPNANTGVAASVVSSAMLSIMIAKAIEGSETIVSPKSAALCKQKIKEFSLA